MVRTKAVVFFSIFLVALIMMTALPSQSYGQTSPPTPVPTDSGQADIFAYRCSHRKCGAIRYSTAGPHG